MPEKTDTLKMVFAGDVLPKTQAAFDMTRSMLKEADIAFGQLENLLTTRGTPQVFEFPPELNRRPGAPPPKGRMHGVGDPAKELQVLVDAGFNVMSFASNHTYLRSDEGVIDTVEALKSKNIICIGAGKDITEATKPAIFDIKGNKVGLLAYCSVVVPGGWATTNKGGVAPLRANTSYEQIDWQPGTPPRTISRCNQDDLAGMEEDIKKLKSQVDVAVVSVHWGVHFVPGLIADYQFEAGHAAIDAGADLIIGHHPHILKGIEVYKGKAIFYGVGNFSMYTLSKFTPIKASGLYWMTRFENNVQVDPDEYPYYPYPIDSQKTLLVKCDVADRKIQRVSYLPMWVNGQSQPEVVSHDDERSEEHLQYMRWMCGSQGLDTNFIREGDEVVIIP